MDTWRYIEEDGVSASYGLAADEFMMGYFPHDAPQMAPVLRLYTYKTHCALVGRFQNIEAELNLDACRKENVAVSRRPTGGGAILMGENQLGLCLTAPAAIEKKELKPGEIYRLFSEPVVEALADFGIPARLRGKNDLEVNGKKIAGLGVYYDARGALLFHTSLIVDLDIPLMLKVLNIPLQKYADRAIRAVEHRITTVNREARAVIRIQDIRNRIKARFEDAFQMQLVSQPVSDAERTEIKKLEHRKYNHDDWLFQRSPQPDMTGMSLVKTPKGLLRTYISLKGDTIKSVLITGDYLAHDEVLSQIEAGLKWQPFKEKKISEVVLASLRQGGSELDPAPIEKAIWRAGIRCNIENKHTYTGSCYYPPAATQKVNISKTA